MCKGLLLNMPTIAWGKPGILSQSMPPKKWTKYVCLALEREKIFLCYLRASFLKLKGQKKAEGGCEQKMLVSSRWKNKSLNPVVSTDLKKKNLAISYITRVIKMHFLPILFCEMGSPYIISAGLGLTTSSIYNTPASASSATFSSISFYK